MDEAEFNEFILANMPYFIAINYQRLEVIQNPQERVKLILHIYNLGLRALTISLVSQYVFRDYGFVNNPYLVNLLKQKFPHLTHDAWEDMFFTILKAYEGNEDLFFMPELYDFYWDSSIYPHTERIQMKFLFDRLTQVTLELESKRLVPQDESRWKALAEELIEHLRKILHGLSFLEKYDLIHVLDQDEHSYTFELHKGTHISTSRESLPKSKLDIGWFYLRAGMEDFLPLHPLLVFWEGTVEPGDTGVFDRMINAQLLYLLAISGQTRSDDKRASDFVRLIYTAITDVKREQQELEKLTWLQLRDICENITRHRIATVQGRYHPGLYLQRDEIHQQFETFLADPKKRGFVLVGKSGVGKSNFLLALAEELRLRNNVCMLMYDGANLPVATSSLTEIISRDFSDRVLLFGQQVQQVWREIARIDGIDERKLLLCVDAINENPEAKELLRQLDALVQGPWPWLKILLSCRPETWKEIKRGVKMAEALYYRGQEGGVLGVELEPFSYSEQMEPFAQRELLEVYNKYQLTFQLQTPYHSLSPRVREMLRDPLNLWLLASTHRGQEIPANVKTSELIEQYIHALLQREDRRFLEDRLVPLMVREHHYSNVITEADLSAAGGALYEMVYSDMTLSDGRRMNESFLHLADADILVQQQQGFEHQIAFKYERFYEYFIGKRLVQLGATQKNRFVFFSDMIEATAQTPFLWGPVRNALVQEVKDGRTETLQRLCFTDQQRVKEMIVNVFIHLGKDDPQQVENILKQLIPQEKQLTKLQKIPLLLGKSAGVLDLPARNAIKIAIEVASDLNIAWILRTAALQADPTIRTIAVRYSFYLWQHDREVGFRILEYIAKKAVPGLIPDITAFESVFGLSVIIFLDYYQDVSILRRLQDVWREAIARLLHIQEGNGSLKGVVPKLIEKGIISFIITMAFRLYSEFPEYNTISYQRIEEFYRLGAEEKALYRNLVHYMDVAGGYSREQMYKDYLEVIKIDNVLFASVTEMSLTAHAFSAPLAFLPFLKQLFEDAKKEVLSYPYLTDITSVVSNLLEVDPTVDEIFDFFVSAVEVCQEYYARYPHTVHSGYAKAPQVFYLGSYVFHQYRRTGTVKTAWFETRIQAALTANNNPFFHLLLTSELPLVGIELRAPKIALAALELFFNSDNPAIRQMIQSFLSRLRVHYPDEVEDFLIEQQAPDDFRLQVRTHEPVERVGELIGLRGWHFLRDVIISSPELRSQLMHVFEKAADCKNTRTWIDYLIRYAINLIYGRETLNA